MWVSASAQGVDERMINVHYYYWLLNGGATVLPSSWDSSCVVPVVAAPMPGTDTAAVTFCCSGGGPATTAALVFRVGACFSRGLTLLSPPLSLSDGSRPQIGLLASVDVKQQKLTL